jgi:hypothetical protein
VPKRGGYFGAFANESGDQYSALRAFERIVGRKIKIANKYHPFRTGSLSFEADALRGGRIPLISWRGTDSGTDPNRASKIAAGQYDSVIRSMADRVKALSGRVLIRFNWEMDQSPGDRQFIGEPKEFIAAWRHIVGIFRQRGARNAEWVWAPRAGSFSHGEGQLFYPGGLDRWVGRAAGQLEQLPRHLPRVLRMGREALEARVRLDGHPGEAGEHYLEVRLDLEREHPDPQQLAAREGVRLLPLEDALGLQHEGQLLDPGAPRLPGPGRAP